MKQQLFSVLLKNKRTDENIELLVWGKNVDEATNQLCSALFGVNGEYRWQGSGPVHENNEIITREI